jgi:mannose-6-phosphate isomerase-like protein (cupin superfamily)
MTNDEAHTEGQDTRRGAQVVHLEALAAQASAAGAAGAVWSLAEASDLNLNVVRFAVGDGVEAHINAEVDVVWSVVAGSGTADVDGRQVALAAGDLLYVPKGARRAIHATGGDLVYLTCHRRRAGLMPERAQR